MPYFDFDDDFDVDLTNKCPRCLLRYDEDEKQCTHCGNLTDHEVEILKSKYKEEHKSNAAMGKLFFLLAALIIVGMAIL